MESKKAFHLLTLVFSLLMIEKSMVSQVLAQYYPLPDDDNSRSAVHGSPLAMDKKLPGNSSDGRTLEVPPPATKTTIEVSTAVSPTSNTSSTSVSSRSKNSSTSFNSNSNNSSSSVTSGGTTSKSSSTQVNKSSSSSSRSVTPPNNPW